MPEPTYVRQTDLMDRPSYWQGQAWNDLRSALQGRGNTPERCLANCVNSLVKALERGAVDVDLCADNPPGANGMPIEPDLVRVWRATAAALENEAVVLYQAQQNAAAQVEARNSMTPVG